MVAIPAISMESFGYDSGLRKTRASPDDFTAVAGELSLTNLPADLETRKGEVESLREWVRGHFSEDEIADMRARFVDGRTTQEVNAEIHELAEEFARNDYRGVPGDIADLLKSRLGSNRARTLKRRVDELQAPAYELKEAAMEEMYSTGMR